MTLVIGNDDVARVLTMDMVLEALEDSYRRLATGEAVCRPRIDVRIPTRDPSKTYRWGTMEGGSTSGYFAIRMKSDVIYQQTSGGAVTEQKYCTRPGLYCGLILLTDIESGEPLAIIHDGIVQHLRVGADGGIGVKYMANEDAAVVGMLGSGGMARSHMAAFARVRHLERLQVFSPTRAHREAFAREMAETHGIVVRVCDRPEAVYEGADIVAAVTNSTAPVLEGGRLEKGTHVVNVGGGGRPDAATLERIDVYLRFGNAPAPRGRPELTLPDEYLTYAAEPRGEADRGAKPAGTRAHGVALPDRVVYLDALREGRSRGRTSRDQITYSERGNLQGAQFFAIAGKVYELAKAEGLGREIPTEWLLQDVRD